MTLKFIVHYSFHFIIPLLIAFFFFKQKWKLVYFILVATMVIDLDHLLANPIYDSTRCSINFHPLHTYYAIGFYFLILIPKKTRIISIGLLTHIIADSIDCLL